MNSFKFLNPPIRQFSLGFIPSLVSQNTGNKMRDIIRESANNEYVRKWAEHITGNVPDRDEYHEVDAIFRFLQMNTRYVHDPANQEYIQTPHYVLQQIEHGMTPGLDCDDYTVTGLSLVRSLGYPSIIRIVSFRPDGKYSHVYGVVRVNGEWMPFDAVRKDAELGWEAPRITKKLDIQV